MELSHILLAMDPSKHSRHALRATVTLARAFEAEVTLLHAIPTFEEYRVRRELFQNAVAHLEGEGQRILDEAAETLESEGVPHRQRLLRGNPVEAILTAAREEPPDLIVAGSRGTSRSELYTLGSVSFRVAVLAPTNVLIVRSDRPIRRILVPLDRSDRAARAADWGAALAQQLDASLSLLFVIESDPAQVKFTVSTGYAEPFLKKTEKRLQEAGVDPTRIVEYGHPATEIVRRVEEEGFDLVCMGARGTADTPLFTLGGVTSRVLRQAPASVAVVRDAWERGG